MKLSKIILFVILPLLIACDKLSEKPTFEIDQANVLALTRDILAQTDSVHYADQWLVSALAGDTCSIWIDGYGVITSADTLLTYLRNVEKEGISPDFFKVEHLQTHIDSIKSWSRNGRFALLTDTIAADIEADLTRSLLRYAYSQRYGYILPHPLLNNLLVDGDAPEGTKRRYRQLYDIHCEVPTDSLSHVAIEYVHNDRLGDFLRAVQPDNKLHSQFIKEYQRAVATKDTALVRKAMANLERSRWRYERPDTGMYVMVNIAAQTLWAVDENRDSCIDMRICCGNLTHKSPLLTSKISYIELDPYWQVPMSIIRNEIVKLHLNDSAYFARNRMFAVNNETKETVNPVTLSASQWKSGRYTLKQDKGAGNSLGRMVFRFPNIFSVYLHDTNSPGAFNRDKRTVSHGCIRVQKPVALATFMLSPEVTPLYLDRMRMSIDLPPLTAEGRKLKEQEPKPLKRCDLKKPVPLWIDYYTLYPDRKGNIHEYPDIYSYDEAISAAMKPYVAHVKK